MPHDARIGKKRMLPLENVKVRAADADLLYRQKCPSLGRAIRVQDDLRVPDCPGQHRQRPSSVIGSLSAEIGLEEPAGNPAGSSGLIRNLHVIRRDKPRSGVDVGVHRVTMNGLYHGRDAKLTDLRGILRDARIFGPGLIASSSPQQASKPTRIILSFAMFALASDLTAPGWAGHTRRRSP